MAETKKKHIIPAKMTASVAKTSEDHVLKIRAGKRQNGKVAKRVKLADQMLETGTNKLMEAVKKAVNF